MTIKYNGKPKLWVSILHRMAALCWTAWGITIVILLLVFNVLLGLGIVGFIVYRTGKSVRRRSGTHGTAEWISAQELQDAGCLLSNNGVMVGDAVGMTPPKPFDELRALLSFPIRRSAEAVILAQQSRRSNSLPVCIPDTYPHISIFGATGGGKSTCYAIPMLLGCRDCMVVLDVKGELSRLTAMHRHVEFGHEIIILDFFGVTNGCGFAPSRFNPLDLYRGNERRAPDEARRLANAFVVPTGKENDEFWTKYARSILTAVLTFLMVEATPNTSFNEMRDLIASPRLMDELIRAMIKSEKCFGLLSRMAEQLQHCKGQTKASVYAVCNAHIEFLDSIGIAETLSESTFDPRQLIHGKMTIFIALPPDRIEEMSGIQRVLLTSLINLVFEAGEDRNRRVRFLMDEAATLRSLESVYSAVQFGRSYGLRMMFLYQAASQVDLCFPEARKDDFFASVASIYCATNEIATAKVVSESIGTTTVHSRSDQRSSNWGKTAATGLGDQSRNVNWGTGDSTSYNEIARPLIRPEEVLQLPRNLAIVLMPGLKPLLTLKRPYYLKQHTAAVDSGVLSILTSLIAVVASLILIPLILWMATIGRDHPLVQDFWQHMTRDLRSNFPHRI